MQQSTDFLQKCQDNFFDHLIGGMSDDDEDNKELIHQLIIRQATSILHKNTEKLEHVFLRSFMSEYNSNPEIAIQFMHKYIDQYYAEDSYMISDVVRELLGESVETENSLYNNAALDLHKYQRNK